MLRGIIVEDEIGAKLNLENLIPLVSNNIDIVASADSVETAVKCINDYQPDFVFMDVQIKGGSGFDVLEQVDFKKFKIIFVTAFENYALKAFQFSATDYLLKPIDEDDLRRTIEKIEDEKKDNQPELIESLLKNLNSNSDKEKFIIVNSIKSVERFLLSEIIYCESFRNYTTFYLQNGEEIVSSKSLKEYENILNDEEFIRAHRSFIVNKDCIRKFEKEEGGMLVLSDGKKIPVSQRKREHVMKSLFK